MSNLVVITSIFYTPWSVYSYEERLKQIENSIASVRTHIPNSYVVLLEGGTARATDIEYFKNIVDEYITINVTSLLKSVGEFTLLHTYFNMESTKSKILECNSISKLSGRYYFNDNFSFEKYTDRVCIKYRVDHNNLGVFETRYYKMPASYFTKFLTRLNTLAQDSTFMTGYEDIEHGMASKGVFLVEDATQNDLIGISGNIAPDGSPVED